MGVRPLGASSREHGWNPTLAGGPKRAERNGAGKPGLDVLAVPDIACIPDLSTSKPALCRVLPVGNCPARRLVLEGITCPVGM